MPGFSINVSMMLQEYSFLDRFKVAADAGFAGVDIQFPYDVPAKQIAQAVEHAGVEVVLLNLPAGDLVNGGRGLASEPDRQQAYRDAVQMALPYIEALGVTRVNVLAGKADSIRPRQQHVDTLMANLEYTLRQVEAFDVTVMLEPVNGTDVPDFLLQSIDDVVEVINKVEKDKIKIQFDIYHHVMMAAEVVPALQKHLPLIAHIQFADSPGRHEPGTGDIKFSEIFNQIDTLGYTGWVGAEYNPSKATLETLSWFQN